MLTFPRVHKLVSFHIPRKKLKIELVSWRINKTKAYDVLYLVFRLSYVISSKIISWKINENRFFSLLICTQIMSITDINN